MIFEEDRNLKCRGSKDIKTIKILAINIVFLSPILIPILKDRVIHIPGVIDTKKKVGIKIAKIERLM